MQLRNLNGAFSRIFINEESVEEEEALSFGEPACRDGDWNRSLINEDKERHGEQLSSLNVTP